MLRDPATSWKDFAVQADAVAAEADKLLVMARDIENPSATARAREIRDKALNLYNDYNKEPH